MPSRKETSQTTCPDCKGFSVLADNKRIHGLLLTAFALLPLVGGTKSLPGPSATQEPCAEIRAVWQLRSFSSIRRGSEL